MSGQRSRLSFFSAPERRNASAGMLAAFGDRDASPLADQASRAAASLLDNRKNSIHAATRPRGLERQAAVLRGRPPRFPFSRAAEALLGDRDLPPLRPIRPAIQLAEPKTPSSNAGIYRSASSFGK